MTSSSTLGSAPRSPSSSSSTATSTPPPRTCRRRSRRSLRKLPPQMPTPPTLAQGQPGRLADPLHGDELRHAADCRRWTNMPRPCWRGNFDPRRRGAGQRVRLGRNMPCASRPIPPRWRRARSASISLPTRSMRRNVNLATGTLNGRHASDVIHANGQLKRRRVQQPDRRLSQRRAGAPRRCRQRHRQRGEHPHRKLVQRPARHRARASSASPAPTPSRWSTRSSRSLPHFMEQLPASVQA